MRRKWLAKINVAIDGYPAKWVKIGAEQIQKGCYRMVASNGDEMSDQVFFSLSAVLDAIDRNWSFRIWETTFLMGLDPANTTCDAPDEGI